jgi:hypothetical protein
MGRRHDLVLVDYMCSYLYYSGAFDSSRVWYFCGDHGVSKTFHCIGLRPHKMAG